MTVKILLSLFFGFAVGGLLKRELPVEWIENGVTWGLGLLIFLVGIDLGSNRKLLQELRRLGMKVLMLPLAIAMGSIAGAFVVGSLIGLAYNSACAVGAGFGWYTLSGVILAKFDAQLGAIAFLSNVFREVLAIVFIPVLAKRCGPLYTLAPAGATAMDTTLPIITRSTSSSMGLVSFISGAVLSTLVPFLVPLLYQL